MNEKNEDALQFTGELPTDECHRIFMDDLRRSDVFVHAVEHYYRTKLQFFTRVPPIIVAERFEERARHSDDGDLFIWKTKGEIYLSIKGSNYLFASFKDTVIICSASQYKNKYLGQRYPAAVIFVNKYLTEIGILYAEKMKKYSSITKDPQYDKRHKTMEKKCVCEKQHFEWRTISQIRKNVDDILSVHETQQISYPEIFDRLESGMKIIRGKL